MRVEIQSLDHLVLTVANLEKTVDFYTNALGMTAQNFTPADGSSRWALSFGQQKINLHQAGAEFLPKAIRPAPGSADLCFLSEIPLERWMVHLSNCGIPIEEGPVPRTGAQAPILSIYIRDPDGNLIEIANKSEA